LIFINAEGNEIDRIIGYRPVEEFLLEIERINNNRGTIETLTEKLKTNPKNETLLLKLAEKWDERGSSSSALTYWEMLLNQGENNDELALYKVAQTRTKIEKTPIILLSFINEQPENKYLPDAYRGLQGFYKSERDTVNEAKAYLNLITFLVKMDNASTGDLNGYAWRMTQLELNLEDALEKVRQAVLMASDQNDKSQAQIMDTEAEVLWKLGQTEKAVAVINKCILLQPEDDYYKTQKEKFQNVL